MSRRNSTIALFIGRFHTDAVKKFEDLLASRANPSVIRRMWQRYYNRAYIAVQTANAQMAEDVYRETEDLPQTSTQQALEAEGYLFNGPFPYNEKLILCFRGLEVCVMKALDNAERSRLATLCAALPDGAGHPNVIDFKVHNGRTDRRQFMAMPLVESTLEHMASLTSELSLVLWRDCKAGLEWLHSLGFAHNDVKPANIGLKAGRFVLIDLGSIAPLGMPSQRTRACIPADLIDQQHSPAIDWWMLAMTLADRCCGSAGIKLGEGATDVSTQELLAILKASLNPAILEQLLEKLAV